MCRIGAREARSDRGESPCDPPALQSTIGRCSRRTIRWQEPNEPIRGTADPVHATSRIRLVGQSPFRGERDQRCHGRVRLCFKFGVGGEDSGVTRGIRNLEKIQSPLCRRSQDPPWGTRGRQELPRRPSRCDQPFVADQMYLRMAGRQPVRQEYPTRLSCWCGSGGCRCRHHCPLGKSLSRTRTHSAASRRFDGNRVDLNALNLQLCTLAEQVGFLLQDASGTRTVARWPQVLGPEGLGVRAGHGGLRTCGRVGAG